MNATRDVLISCMALPGVPDWMPWPGGPPDFFEFAGQQPTGGGHPTWGGVASRLRDSQGRLLPNLFAQYRQFLGYDLSQAGRIGIVGFSAGSNSGLRELLRNPVDRARISFVAAIDGEHPNLAASPPTADQLRANPLRRYADWQTELGGIEDIATAAALDAGPAVVVTASSVAAPSSVNSDTRSALTDLEWKVLANVQAAGRSLVGPVIAGPFPDATSSGYLRPGESHPQPFTVGGCRRFVALYYAGNQARDHVLQARLVLPDVLRAVLIPFWSTAAAEPVAARIPIREVVESLTPPELSPAAGWLPAALSVAALVGAAVA